MNAPNPRAYDDKFIKEQLDEMVRKGWTALEIASWFSHSAFEEGKMEIMRLYSGRTKQESKQLKIQIAGQCIAGILANNSEYNVNATNEQLAKFAWDVTTELVKLSEQEENK